MSESDTLVFIAAYLLRLFLVFCGDIFSPEGVKYQDIDYEVFTNASRHIYNGGTAFDCDTYRYTPLLAWILQPNIWLHPEFGKIVFITLDILGAYLLNHIITYHLQQIHRTYHINSTLWVSIVWLFNPIVFTISSRGSCDSIILILVLLTFHLILNQQWYKAGIVYGAAVHFRIYPFIYALSFVLFITHLNMIQDRPPKKRISALDLPLSTVIRHMIFNINVWSFGLMSLLSFMLLNIVCYEFMGGDTYVQESYLYHLTRVDDQHNFSFYFYFFRLSRLNSYDQLDIISNCIRNVMNDRLGYCFAPLVSRFAFIPQLGYIVVTSLSTYKHLHLALFMTTYIFVTFNKVCTSQYFTWYICLLPLVLPFIRADGYTVFGYKVEKTKSVYYGMVAGTVLWCGGNGNWLYWAYQLEIMNKPERVFMVFCASIVFCVINNVLIFFVREHYESYPLLLNYVKLPRKIEKKGKATKGKRKNKKRN
eukprot:270863_1